MDRLLMEALKDWKGKPDRLPLILKGARQVGKSWLLQEFGRTCFEDVVYVNFENAGNLSEIFDGVIEPQRIIDYLGAVHGRRIEPQRTLVIFDEVQEVPRALTSLKYFAEQAPKYAICCAGSLLGVALHSGTSFPVGKVEFLSLQPLSFQEFLLANGKEAICDFIRGGGFNKLPENLYDDLSDLLKQYFVVGGMPQAVQTWLTTRDFSKVGAVQNNILETYQNDFSKHAPASLVPRLRYLWNSIPSQLARENKKFVYGLIREGARAREYEDALLWLQDSGLIRKVGCVTAGSVPLKAYEDLKAFKLYHLDVGLLARMSELSPASIIDKTGVFQEFKGALTEQFVLQELAGRPEIHSLYYWTSKAAAEVDFLFDWNGHVVPVEAKAGMVVHAQSLKQFRMKYQPDLSIKTSLRNLDCRDGVLNLPLTLLWNLPLYLDAVFTASHSMEIAPEQEDEEEIR